MLCRALDGLVSQRDNVVEEHSAIALSADATRAQLEVVAGDDTMRAEMKIGIEQTARTGFSRRDVVGKDVANEKYLSYFIAHGCCRCWPSAIYCRRRTMLSVMS